MNRTVAYVSFLARVHAYLECLVTCTCLHIMFLATCRVQLRDACLMPALCPCTHVHLLTYHVLITCSVHGHVSCQPYIHVPTCTFAYISCFGHVQCPEAAGGLSHVSLMSMGGAKQDVQGAVCMYKCMYVCVYACVCVCVDIYIYIYIYIYISMDGAKHDVPGAVCTYACSVDRGTLCMYVHMHVCMCVYLHMADDSGVVYMYMYIPSL
jgi:hypothetical protein